MDKFTTFLMFKGQAEEAMKFYTSLFDNSEISFIQRFGSNNKDNSNLIQHAQFNLNGQTFIAMDNPNEVQYDFTPAVSIFVSCETEDEITNLYNNLSDKGEIRVKLDTYPFSKKYGWVNDKFGVSWQLILA